MMNIQDSNKHACPLVFFVCLLLLASGIAQDKTAIRSLPLPEARVRPGGVAEGSLWVQWQTDHKLGYVQGLLGGVDWGYYHACTEASLIARLPNLQDECLAKAPAVRLRPDQYVALITEFYSRYPQDRALPIRHLLMKLMEPHTDSEAVHKWLDELIQSVQHSRPE